MVETWTSGNDTGLGQWDHVGRAVAVTEPPGGLYTAFPSK